MTVKIYSKGKNFYAVLLEGSRKLDEIGPFASWKEAEIESCYKEKELLDVA